MNDRSLPFPSPITAPCLSRTRRAQTTQASSFTYPSLPPPFLPDPGKGGSLPLLNAKHGKLHTPPPPSPISPSSLPPPPRKGWVVPPSQRKAWEAAYPPPPFHQSPPPLPLMRRRPPYW